MFRLYSDGLLTYGQIRNALHSARSLAHNYRRPWSEKIEMFIAEFRLHKLLKIHHSDNFVSDTELAQFKDLFQRRWHFIKEAQLAYPYNTKSIVNQQFLALGVLLQPFLGVNLIQLLMPEIASHTSSITMTDLNESEIGVTDIVLSDDRKSFIELIDCLLSAVEDGVLKHTQLLDADGKAQPLSEDERNRVIFHSKETKSFYKAIMLRYQFKHNGATLGAILQMLSEGLRSGGEKNTGDKRSAGANANLAILAFSQVYNKLPAEQREMLDNMRDSVHDFKYYWHILAIEQQEKLDRINANKQLTDRQRMRAFAKLQKSIASCVELTSHGLDAMLEANKDVLFSTVIQLDASIKQAELISRYDDAVQNRQRWLQIKLKSIAGGEPYSTRDSTTDTDHYLENEIFAWLALAEEDELLYVIKSALTHLGVEFVAAMFLPHLHERRHELCLKLMLPQLRMQLPNYIVAGETHNLIVNKSGKVYVNGKNHCGQLGLGDTAKRKEPTPISGFNPDGKIIQMAAGKCHSLFLSATGTVYGCGSNRVGELGLGETELQTSPVVIPIAPGAKVVQLAAGSAHSLFLTDTGELYACGNNASGQLGVNDKINRLRPTALTNFNGKDKIVYIAAGNCHSLILTSTGKVYAFGENTYGQLGLGDLAFQATPIEIASLPEGVKIVQVSAGLYHSLFLTAGGEVFFTGCNDLGQSGVIDHRNIKLPRQIVDFPANTVISQIEAGGHHNLFLASNERVFSNGWNTYGQRGVGDGPCNSHLVEVTDFFPLDSHIVQIASGRGNHSLFLSNSGKVYACGNNDNLQLGLSGYNDTTLPRPFPHLSQLVGLIAAAEAADKKLTITLQQESTLFFIPHKKRSFNKEAGAEANARWLSAARPNHGPH